MGGRKEGGGLAPLSTGEEGCGEEEGHEGQEGGRLLVGVERGKLSTSSTEIFVVFSLLPFFVLSLVILLIDLGEAILCFDLGSELVGSGGKNSRKDGRGTPAGGRDHPLEGITPSSRSPSASRGDRS